MGTPTDNFYYVILEVWMPTTLILSPSLSMIGEPGYPYFKSIL
jgi:hypothetical protein